MSDSASAARRRIVGGGATDAERYAVLVSKLMQSVESVSPPVSTVSLTRDV